MHIKIMQYYLPSVTESYSARWVRIIDLERVNPDLPDGMWCQLLYGESRINNELDQIRNIIALLIR